MKNKIINFMFLVIICLMTMLGSIIITFESKWIYYYDAKQYRVYEEVNMSYEEVKNNYDVLMDYITNHNIQQLIFPSFPMSQSGKIHFKEVKEIYQIIKNLFIIDMILLIGLCIYVQYNKKIVDIKVIKCASITNIVLPILLGGLISLNLDKSFIIFHKILFRNDYWLFDPYQDPIIMILPEQFFYHCGFMILGIICFASMLLYLYYVRIKSRL